MINHARTLLMNVDGDGIGGRLGDQYIPPTYRAVSLPTELRNLRALFFGASPDRVMLNYRCQQLLAMLAATELQQFVADLDSRITYDVNDATFFSPVVFRPTVMPSDAAWVTGEPNPADASGRCEYSWELSLSGDTTMQIRSLAGPPTITTHDFTLTGNLSSMIPLPGTGMHFRFRGYSVGAWKVDAVARPVRGLGEIETSLRSVGEPNILRIFGVGSARANTEPWTTFYNLWLRHTDMAYALGGLVLGMIYYTERLRRGEA